MAKLGSIKLNIDAEEIDRLAIGGRVYDKLNLSNPNNIFKVKDGELVLCEMDIENIIKLINEPIKLRKISIVKNEVI